MNDNEKLRFLFQKYVSGEVTPGEKDELANLILLADNETVAALLKKTWEDSINSGTGFDMEDRDSVINTILEKDKPQPPVIKLFKRRWFRIAAAACLILMLGVSAFFLFNAADHTSLAEIKLPIDIAPPKDAKATITLTNGQQVYLDSATNGVLALQSNIKLVKLESGDIVYQDASGETITELQYNTLSNPRGSKVVSLTLNDGTKVWLNSESSLKYPVAFVGAERNVEITGEAYFEVAKDISKPFKVNIAGKGEVEVLGTHFNINSYEDEPAVNTTLLEGSVKVTSLATQQSLLIKPGEQAQLNVNGQIRINKNADTEEVMAWKNGRFQFEGAGVEDVMRQIARWYDVSVVYEGKPKEQHFRGGISRNVEVTKVFKMLETTGAIRYRIEGSRIIVMP